MKCPVCENINLVMSDRQGVEIDYCPECRGVWLDRGELDKIIERSAAPAVSPQPERHYEGHDKRDQEYRKSKKSRGGLLGDLFDF